MLHVLWFLIVYFLFLFWRQIAMLYVVAQSISHFIYQNFDHVYVSIWCITQIKWPYRIVCINTKNYSSTELLLNCKNVYPTFSQWNQIIGWHILVIGLLPKQIYNSSCDQLSPVLTFCPEFWQLKHLMFWVKVAENIPNENYVSCEQYSTAHCI